MSLQWSMIFVVGLGGGIGAIARYLFSTAVTHLLGSGFPWGIFLTNILGSTVMGVLTEFFALRGALPQEVRAFLTVGILGGFTTFSSFSLDSYLLLMRGQELAAVAYMVGSVLISIAGLYIGLHVMRALLP